MTGRITQNVHDVTKWTITARRCGETKWIDLEIETGEGRLDLTLFAAEDDGSKLEPFIGKRQGLSILPPFDG